MRLKSILNMLSGEAPAEDSTAACCVPPSPARAFGAVSAMLLAAVLLLALWVRLDGIGRPVWIDEALTLQWAGKPYLEILKGNITPFLPLLAKAMLNLCRSETIPGEVIVRIPSLVWGSLTILVLFLYVRFRAGNVAAVVSALFLALSSCHIYFSVDARYYAFQILMSLALFIAVERYMATRQWRFLAGACAFAALGLFNHLSFAFPLAAVSGVAMVWMVVRGNAPLVSRLKYPVAFGLVFLIAALPLLVSHPEKVRKMFPRLTVETSATGTAEQPASPPPPSKYVFRLTPAMYKEFTLRHPDFLLLENDAHFYLMCLVVVAGLIVAWTYSPGLLLLLMAMLCFPIPLFFVSVSHEWYPRYFSSQIPIYAMLAGFASVGGGLVPAKWHGGDRRVAVAASLGTLLAVALIFVPLRMRQMDAWHALVRHLYMKDTLRFLAEETHPGDTLLVAPGRPDWRFSGIMSYYLSPEALFPTVPRPGVFIAYTDNYNQLSTAIAGKKENDTYWVVAPTWNNKDDVALLKKCNATLIFATRLTAVWALTPPSLNMLEGGAFTKMSSRCEYPPGAEIVTGPDAWNGKFSLKVAAPESPDGVSGASPLTVWLPVICNGKTTQQADSLENGQVYTLSLRYRSEGIHPDGDPKNALRVLLSSSKGAQDLLYLQDPPEPPPSGGGDASGIETMRRWRKVEFQLEPGKNVPLDAKNVSIGVGNYSMSGAFWLDDVQLTLGTPAPPYTMGIAPAGR